MRMPLKVISGGQTGVDQAALAAAQDVGLEINGWCPPGRVSESGTIPEQFPLKETPQERSPDAMNVPRSQRTEWNVRDSDGTLIIRPRNTKELDAGTNWTALCTARYGRPLLICDPMDAEAPERIRQWLAALSIGTLNVAGPSESGVPGIGGQAYALLTKVFQHNTPTTKSIQLDTQPFPWWMAVLRLSFFSRIGNLIRASHLSLLILLIAGLLIGTFYVSVKVFGLRIVAGQLYLGPMDQTFGAHVTVDATAGFQNSGIQLHKGQRIILRPEGRIHTAMDHANNLTRAVKGIIVHNTSEKQFPPSLVKRYDMPPLDESIVFYRDWTGSEGEAVYSDLLEDCKLRKELNWGALLAVIIPAQVSARADPYEILKNSGLSSSDLVPIPAETAITAERDGWLTFIINEAVISPHSPSRDSQLYYDSLKRTAESLTGDPRHRIPLQSIPLIWFADNNGAFRVRVTYPAGE